MGHYTRKWLQSGCKSGCNSKKWLQAEKSGCTFDALARFHHALAMASVMVGSSLRLAESLAGWLAASQPR